MTNKEALSVLREQPKYIREYNCTVGDGKELAAALEIAITAIERVDHLEDCIYSALDALDRGTDNDWAREALEAAYKPLKEE